MPFVLRGPPERPPPLVRESVFARRCRARHRAGPRRGQTLRQDGAPAQDSTGRLYDPIMRAAVLYQPGQPLRVEDVELGAPRAGEVRVRVAAAGVCHSDYHYMRGDLVGNLPVVLGHEGAGVVEEVGPGVTSFRPGDHVVLLWRTACGRCEYCSRGRPALCREGTAVRNSGRMPDGTS